MSLSTAQKKKLDLCLGSPLIVVLKICARLLGIVTRRKHDLEPKGELYFLKLMGGGSLIIAAPAILGIRKKFPSLKLGLITTTSVAPFGRVLGVFDDIQIVDDRHIGTLLATSLSTLAKVFRTDTIVDLEVYSRLSSVFSLLACARNRIGFYAETSFWRAGISSHLLFFNRSSGTYVFYDQVARLLGALPATMAECREKMKISAKPSIDGPLLVGIGHGCSNLCPERMLTVEQWNSVLSKLAAENPDRKIRFCFFGVRSERAFADQVIQSLCHHLGTSVEFVNWSGELALHDTIARMSELHQFISVDSSLLHLARLLELKTTSYWGPTDPKTLLRPILGLDETIHYAGVACSPCVHVTETPPCRGANICVNALFSSRRADEALWLMET